MDSAAAYNGMDSVNGMEPMEWSQPMEKPAYGDSVTPTKAVTRLAFSCPGAGSRPYPNEGYAKKKVETSFLFPSSIAFFTHEIYKGRDSGELDPGIGN